MRISRGEHTTLGRNKQIILYIKKKREADINNEPWPQVHPGVAYVRGWYAGRARRRACERRAAAAGWQVPAEPTMPWLNSQVLGF